MKTLADILQSEQGSFRVGRVDASYLCSARMTLPRATSAKSIFDGPFIGTVATVHELLRN
jgi:hypothetical protein